MCTLHRMILPSLNTPRTANGSDKVLIGAFRTQTHDVHRDLRAVQQQDLAVDHAVSDHAPEDGGLCADGADAVGALLRQWLLVDVVEVTECLVHLLPQLSGVSVEF